MPRHPTYLGPKRQIQPSDLDRFEKYKTYVAEEKHDGFWCEVTTDDSGRIVSLVGRSGIKFSGAHVRGLIGTRVNISNSVLIAELESGTEASNKRNPGFKRLHVFDVVQLFGQCTTKLLYEQRRALLEKMFFDVINDRRICLVKQVKSRFSRFFHEVSENNGEGLVLKKIDVQYVAQGSDGKTNHWVRCKRFRFVDYVVIEIGKSEGGSPNLQVGLYDGPRLIRVATIKNLPPELDYHSLVGRVIECKGLEVHDSGALRSGHFERVRLDKEPQECTFAEARNA